MKTRAMLLAAALMAGSAGSASAVDWSGFYAGVQGGFFAGTVTVINNGYEQDTIPITGPFIGGFAGFNVQNNSIVYGLEADLNITSASGEQYINNSIYYFGGGDIDMFGSIRKRIGFATDKWLVFGTAGIAFATGTFWTQYCPDGCAEPYYEDANLFGFVIGAGAEYSLNESVSLRADVRLYNFGSVTLPLGISEENIVDFDLDAATASVGIAWHF